MDELSRRIKQALDDSPRKRKEIAEALGVSAETLSRWAAGQRKPSRENMARLGAELKRSVGWFYGEPAPGEPALPISTLRLVEGVLGAFREAVTAGADPLSVWEEIIGPTEALSEEERDWLKRDPEGLRAYLSASPAEDWDRLGEHERRLVLELIRLFAQRSASDR